MKRSIEDNLRRLRHAWSHTVRCLSSEEIESFIRNDLEGWTTTTRRVTHAAPCPPEDAIWNILDLSHRPFIHRHYGDGLRFVVGRDVAMGFMPLGPFMTLTCDYRVAENQLRQIYTVGGLFFVSLSISVEPVAGGGSRCDLAWTVASRWYLKALHALVLRKIVAMDARVTEEDMGVRIRRRDLRDRGYAFIDDKVDYFTGSQLYPTNVTRPPAPPTRVDVASLDPGQRRLVRAGPREFVVWRKSASEVVVWDAVCPHQGGPLDGPCRQDDRLVCPWHGLAVPGIAVCDASPKADGVHCAVELASAELTITPR